MAITERTVDVDGIDVFLRESAGEGTPTVFVHGNPTSSTDWIPFMERMSGPAVALDLPGWGRSGRPDRAGFDHSLGAYADFTERFLDQVVGGSYKLVVHDWGGLALVPAQRHPDRVERLVVMNTVPYNAGYRWHWLARLWRRRGVGEALNATRSKLATEQLMRLARYDHRPLPDDFIDGVWSNWDKGTSRAILGLYRSADPDVLAAAGSRLDDLTCPTAILWSTDDPYIGIEQARWYEAALPGARLELIEDAGHWLWLDRPEVIDKVVEHLEPVG